VTIHLFDLAKPSAECRKILRVNVGYHHGAATIAIAKAEHEFKLTACCCKKRLLDTRPVKLVGGSIEDRFAGRR
jgi:hypothetical protein